MSPTQSSNVLFAGPSGTGKTLGAKALAVGIVTGEELSDPGQVAEAFTDAVERQLIIPVTMHPRYSYDDMVEGLRPSVTDEGHVTYAIEPGALLQAAAVAGTDRLDAMLPVGTTFTSSTRSTYTVEDVNPYRVKLFRHDTRSNQVSQHDTVSFEDVQRCVEVEINPDDLSHSGKEAGKRGEAAAKLGWTTTKLANAGGIRAVYEQVLQSEGTRPHAVVLFVDELNRADPSRVWGEAITVLEPNRREGQPEEQPVQLMYSKTSFVMPANLHIVGTMNTHDRSVADLDTAYRRRFEWRWTGPDASLLSTYAAVPVREVFDRMNKYIRREHGRDRMIGHAEIMHHKIEARRLERDWTGADGELRALAWTIRTWLLPMLRDTFADDLGQVRVSLGPWRDLVEAVEDQIDDDSTANLWEADETTYDDGGEWWDPMSDAWDAKRVAEALGVKEDTAPVGQPDASAAEGEFVGKLAAEDKPGGQWAADDES